MHKVFTKEQLHSLLSGLSRDELENLIYDLYEDSDLVQKYIEMRFRFDEVSKDLLTEYENIIGRIFFPSRTSFKANTEKASRILAEFQKICPDLQDQGLLVVKILDCEMEILSYGYSSQAFSQAILSMLHSLGSICARLNSPTFDLFIQHKVQGYEDIIVGYEGEQKKELCSHLEGLLHLS